MLNEEIKALQKQRAHELTVLARLKKRKAEVLAKRVRDESRRRRFVARLDGEIREAERLLAEAEANLIGLGAEIE